MHAYPAPSAVDYEHVCLSTEEPEELEPNFTRAAVAAEAELTQSDGRGERRLAVFDRHFLSVRVSRRGAPTQRYWLRLAHLDPRPVRVVSRPWWQLTAGLGLLSTVLFLVGRLPLTPPAAAWPVAAWAALAATLLSAWTAFSRSRDRLEFRSRHGRAPVVRIARRHPDGRSVKHFVAVLTAAIRRAAAEHGGPRAQLLREEMREHRRLCEEAVLAPQDFEEAKRRILKAHG